MTAYYNEIDPYCAQWLRNLIDGGQIAYGYVDDRSIEDVSPSDLEGFTQCHFFAGIGVWSYALRCAGWPDDRPVWTGSCPCQPFSKAGKGKGFADERHLWPAFHWLIQQRRPDTIFGEQVGGKDGEAWFDLVQEDMEGTDYTCGAVTFPACSVGAPHLRQRLYWVAHANQTGPQGRGLLSKCPDKQSIGSGGVAGTVADTASSQDGPYQRKSEASGEQPGQTGGRCFSEFEWLYCTDGKLRPTEPGLLPLADGAPNRVGRLSAYGNTIVAPQAQAFIEAYLGI